MFDQDEGTLTGGDVFAWILGPDWAERRVVPAGEVPVLDAVPINAKLCKGEGVKKGTKKADDSDETTTTTKSPKKRKAASAKTPISTEIQFNTIWNRKQKAKSPSRLLRHLSVVSLWYIGRKVVCVVMA
jgi:hypothetical protein